MFKGLFSYPAKINNFLRKNYLHIFSSFGKEPESLSFSNHIAFILASQHNATNWETSRNRNLFSHGPWGQNSKILQSVRPRSSETCRGILLASSVRWFARIFDFAWCEEVSFQACLCLHMALPPCLHITFPLDASMSKFPFFIRTQSSWVRIHPNDLF